MRYLGRKLHGDDLATQGDLGGGGAVEAWRFVGTSGNPSWQNGWGGYQTHIYGIPCFYKHDERVYMRGLVSGGTLDATAFTVPVGYRPAHNEVFITYSNGAPGRLNVLANGAVMPVGPSHPNWVVLSGISWRAG